MNPSTAIAFSILDAVKSAAKWDKLWRAGELGVDSLKRIGGFIGKTGIPQLRAAPITAKTLAAPWRQMAYDLLSAGKVNLTQAPKALRDSSFRGAVMRNTSSPEFSAWNQLKNQRRPLPGLGDPMALRAWQSRAPQNAGFLPRPLQTVTPAKPFQLPGGGPVDANNFSPSRGINPYGQAPYNASFLTHTNTLSVPNTRNLPGDFPNSTATPDQLRDSALAIGAHEVGHARTLGRGNVPINQHVGALSSPLGITNVSKPSMKNMVEAMAQFSATRRPDINRAQRAATNLPIQKLQEVHPQYLDDLRSRFSRYSKSLQDRLTATAGHLRLNYGYQIPMTPQATPLPLP